MKSKTGAAFFAVISDFLTAVVLLFGRTFLSELTEYMKYHNDPEFDYPVAHYVNTREMTGYGLIGAAAAVMLFFTLRAVVRYIKKLDDRIGFTIRLSAAYVIILPIAALIIIFFTEFIIISTK